MKDVESDFPVREEPLHPPPCCEDHAFKGSKLSLLKDKIKGEGLWDAEYTLGRNDVKEMQAGEKKEERFAILSHPSHLFGSKFPQDFKSLMYHDF